GTAQKLVLNMLSTLVMVRLGYVLGNRMANPQTRNRKLRAGAERILMNECDLDEGAAREALAAAEGDLPVAIVMTRAGIDEGSARERLRLASGSVAKALSIL